MSPDTMTALQKDSNTQPNTATVDTRERSTVGVSNIVLQNLLIVAVSEQITRITPEQRFVTHFRGEYTLGRNLNEMYAEFEGYLVRFQEFYGNTEQAFNEALAAFDLDYGLQILHAVDNAPGIFEAADAIANNMQNMTGRAVVIGAINNYQPVVEAIQQSEYRDVFESVVDYNVDMSIPESYRSIDVVPSTVDAQLAVEIDALIQEILRQIAELERILQLLFKGGLNSMITSLKQMRDKVLTGMKLDLFDKFALANIFRIFARPVPVRAN